MAPLPVVPPSPPRPGWHRAVEIGLRSAHVASMGLVLGGIAMGGTHETLLVPIALTVSSGVLLLASSLRRGCLSLSQGAGLALLAKLALLGLGNVFPGGRLAWYLAATLLTSVASHMPAAWRHWTPAAWALRGVGRQAS